MSSLVSSILLNYALLPHTPSLLDTLVVCSTGRESRVGMKNNNNVYSRTKKLIKYKPINWSQIYNKTAIYEKMFTDTSGGFTHTTPCDSCDSAP